MYINTEDPVYANAEKVSTVETMVTKAPEKHKNIIEVKAQETRPGSKTVVVREVASGQKGLEEEVFWEDLGTDVAWASTALERGRQVGAVS